MNGFDLILYVVGGLIAVILTVLAAVVSSVKYRGLFIALGAASFLVYVWIGVRGYEESRATAWQASQDKAAAEAQLGQIKQQLSDAKVQSAHDIGDLQGQLKIFGQFAPAVLELAKASEANTRKEYEQKQLTNDQLRAFVAQVVKRMRDWQSRERAAEDEVEKKYQQDMAQLYAAHSSEDIGTKKVQDEILAESATPEYDRRSGEEAVYTKFRGEFSQNILDDAVSAREQLINKLGPGAEPKMPLGYTNVPLVFQGTLVGPYPVSSAADYLEQFAKKLVP
jgi:hypothetical protein